MPSATDEGNWLCARRWTRRSGSSNCKLSRFFADCFLLVHRSGEIVGCSFWTVPSSSQTLTLIAVLIVHTFPWIDKSIVRLMKERDFTLKRALKCKRESEKRIYTTLRNKVVMEMKKDKANLFISTINNARGNTKQTWEQIKKLIWKESSYGKKELQLKVIVFHRNQM